MIVECQCGQKNRIPDTPDARRAYLCGRCGSNLYFPASSNTILGGDRPDEGRKRQIPRLSLRDLAILLVVAGGFSYGLWYLAHQPKPDIQPSHIRVPKAQIQPIPTNPVEGREQEIVLQDTGRLGDAELDAEYGEIDARYFGNKLPFIPVIWEPRLKEVVLGDKELGLASYHPELILLNPRIRTKKGKLRTVLCHEMVHIYLYTIGDMKAHHGPAFQTEWHKLWKAGAFQGIPATETERLRLKAWLKVERHRLKLALVELEQRRTDLDAASVKIEGQKALIDNERHVLNDRTYRAGEQGNGRPTDSEIEAFDARVSAFNQRVETFKASVASLKAEVADHKANLKRFNSQVRRYNLIVAYRDGLGEESTIQVEAKEAHPRVSIWERVPLTTEPVPARLYEVPPGQ